MYSHVGLPSSIASVVRGCAADAAEGVWAREGLGAGLGSDAEAAAAVGVAAVAAGAGAEAAIAIRTPSAIC